MADRLFELTVPSMEEYLPDSLYRRARLGKSEQLKLLGTLKKEYPALAARKAELALHLARGMTKRDLARIPVIRDAVLKAAELAGS